MSQPTTTTVAPTTTTTTAPVTTAPVTTTVATPTTNNSASFSSVSLYVGDLGSDVKEGDLFEIFNKLGAVSSIRVCKDAITRRSLGYAYVNYLSQADAEKALETLNHAPIKGRLCRVMWSQRDPSLRKSGKGNVFIKNLDKTITTKNLYDTFLQFGGIVSCKIAFDEKSGESKGYGFIQFTTQDAADLAIQNVNGMLLKNQKVFVAQFVSRKERLAANASKKFTNVYVKNLPDNYDDLKLKELFATYGEIKSSVLMKGGELKNKLFGFVNFDKAEQAEQSVDALNNNTLDGKVLYVSRAQKKAEREMELKAKFEQMRLEQMAKYQGVNLYIKNLDDDIDDAKLRKIFEPFGTITSAKVMTDQKGNNRGFGFVCYTNPDEATKSVTDMNGKIVGNKPLYVALAQRREFRRAQLEAQFATRKQLAARGLGVFNGPVFYQPGPGQPILMPPVPYPMPQGPSGQSGPASMGRGRFPFPMTNPNPGYVVLPGASRGPGGMAVKNVGGRGGNMNAPRRGMKQSGTAQPPATSAPVTTATTSSTSSTGAQPESVVAETSSSAVTLELLQPYSVEDQKTILGDRLYPLIEQTKPDLAGKITGMILDSSSVEEMVQLVNDPKALKAKVEEAIKVLQDYEKQHA
jgi:polyadenylate-binding protein